MCVLCADPNLNRVNRTQWSFVHRSQWMEWGHECDTCIRSLSQDEDDTKWMVFLYMRTLRQFRSNPVPWQTSKVGQAKLHFTCVPVNSTQHTPHTHLLGVYFQFKNISKLSWHIVYETLYAGEITVKVSCANTKSIFYYMKSDIFVCCANTCMHSHEMRCPTFHSSLSSSSRHSPFTLLLWPLWILSQFQFQFQCVWVCATAFHSFRIICTTSTYNAECWKPLHPVIESFFIHSMGDRSRNA